MPNHSKERDEAEVRFKRAQKADPTEARAPYEAEAWVVREKTARLKAPAATTPAIVEELYRTPAPIPDLKPGSYDLNLTRVTFPAQMPSNPPHHRSGAALYYITSGTGTNTIEGNPDIKGPGALIYEPFGLVHQWGNAGDVPFTFLAFNINPEGVAAVLQGPP